MLLSPSAPLAVEFFDPVKVKRCLPGRVEPLDGEALASWLLRYAAPFALAPVELLFDSREIAHTAGSRWTLRPNRLQLEAISTATGTAPHRVAAMTFGDSAAPSARLDDVARRFSRRRHYLQPCEQDRRRPISVCPHCLANDPVPYIRRDWTVGWVAVCPLHRTVLATSCPGCRTDLDLPLPASREVFRPARCRRCAINLVELPRREAHPISLEFQQRLLNARVSGTFHLSGHGRIDWVRVLRLFSLLLSIVYREMSRTQWRALFAHVSYELGVKSPPRNLGDHYAGLLLLAWIVRGWPNTLERLLPTSEILKRISLDSSVEPDAILRRELVDDILAPAWARAARSLTPQAAPMRAPARMRKMRREDRPRNPPDFGRLRLELINYLMVQGARYDNAKDLAQETLLRLVKRGDVGIRDRRALTLAIGRNLFFGYLRKLRLREASQVTIEVFFGERHDARDALRVVVGTEMIDRLTSALARLPKSHCNAWIHARLSGDSQSTTAYEVGMTRVMVKKALDRADVQLKEVLSEVRTGC